MKQIVTLFADWANGIFAVFIAAAITNTEIVWWHFLIGISLAMCPDLDAIPELLKRGKIAASAEHNHDHRDLLHFPLLFLIVGIILISLFGYWGWLFLTATMLHFVNDLYGTGWGIPLFWPFTKDRFKFLTDENNNPAAGSGNWFRRVKVLNLANEIAENGTETWVDDFYYRFNPVMAVEYSLFAFALLLVVVEFT